MKKLISGFLLAVCFGLTATAQTTKPSRMDSIANLIRRKSKPTQIPLKTTAAKSPVKKPDTGSLAKLANSLEKGKQAVSNGIVTNNGSTSIKNLDNGITFSVTGCTGNAQNQTVTLSFTFSNPNKVHQAIILAFRSGAYKTNALDSQSNTFEANSLTLGGDNFSPGTYGYPTKQLPTGNTLNGSITFSNVLSSVKQLSLVNIVAQSQNWSGGGDKKGGVIEVRNVTVNWN